MLLNKDVHPLVIVLGCFLLFVPKMATLCQKLSLFSSSCQKLNSEIVCKDK